MLANVTTSAPVLEAAAPEASYAVAAPAPEPVTAPEPVDESAEPAADVDPQAAALQAAFPMGIAPKAQGSEPTE
jgi:hypothetical protein